MGGKRGSRKIVGFTYKFGMQAVLGLKPIDRLIRGFCDGKVMFDTPAASGVIAIDRPRFFSSGEVPDGMVGGIALRISGSPGFDAYLQANYPVEASLVPRFDAFAYLTFHDGAATGPYSWGNLPRPRTIELIAERTSTTCPFASFALLPYTDVASNEVNDFNPICMYWELFIKDDPARYGSSFEAAAETVFDEGLGVYAYVGGGDREALQREIMRYVNGRVYTDRASGLREIVLIRAGTSAGLPVIGEADKIGEPDLTVPDPASAFNTWDCTFTDRTKRYETAAFTVYDEALVAAYGTRRRPEIVEYGWVTSRAKAVELARRDLRAEVSGGLIGSIRLSGLRPDLNEGSRFILDLPTYGFSTVVCRIEAIRERGPRDNSVDVTFAEDVFGLEVGPIVVDDLPVELDSVAAPAPLQVAIEAPYYLAYQGGDIDEALETDPGFGGLLSAASRPDGVHLAYEVHVDTGAGYEETATVGFTPGAVLAAAAGKYDTAIEVQPMAGVAVGDVILVGETEFMRVDGIAPAATWTLTVGRGCIDTPPVAHEAGEAALSMTGAGGNEREYTDNQAIDVKYLPYVSADTLAIGAATALPLTFDSRAFRPYPVGDLRVENAYEPPGILSGEVSVSWAHRDRLLQIDETYAEDHTDPDIGPEAGVAYSLVRRLIDIGEVVSHSDETPLSPPQTLTTTVDLDDAAFAAYATSSTIAMEIGIKSVRDGLENWRTPVVRFFTVFAAGPYGFEPGTEQQDVAALSRFIFVRAPDGEQQVAALSRFIFARDES